MVDIVTDLHLHSKYSRAVSPQMVLHEMNRVAIQKGIDILATGDFTHPLWMREIRSQLEEREEGLYTLKHEKDPKTRFLLSVEISCIYSQDGKGRRVHQVILVPSFETVEKVNKELVKRGCNITSDGRPIIGMSSKHLLEMVLTIDERSLLIPAHIWTPWFGIYGQQSGFESLEEAFGELNTYVYAIETGLSSDPEMNWQVKELETRSILSFSDAHSPSKMGREATSFQLESLSYENIRQAIMRQSLPKNKQQSDNKVLYTIEFYPEEGKYHYSGHRKCGVTMTPEEQRASGGICPVCHRKVTDGVMRRVTQLSQENPRGKHMTNQQGIVWIKDPKNIHPPFVRIVPLPEVIAEAVGSSIASQKVQKIFEGLCGEGRSEFSLLLKLPLVEIEKAALQMTSGENAVRIREGIQKVREENIVIQPGYDGVYGTVKIWSGGRDVDKDTDVTPSKKEQISLKF